VPVWTIWRTESVVLFLEFRCWTDIITTLTALSWLRRNNNNNNNNNNIKQTLYRPGHALRVPEG